MQFFLFLNFKFLEYNLPLTTCKLADKAKRNIHVK